MWAETTEARRCHMRERRARKSERRPHLQRVVHGVARFDARQHGGGDLQSRQRSARNTHAVKQRGYRCNGTCLMRRVVVDGCNRRDVLTPKRIGQRPLRFVGDDGLEGGCKGGAAAHGMRLQREQRAWREVMWTRRLLHAPEERAQLRPGRAFLERKQRRRERDTEQAPLRKEWRG